MGTDVTSISRSPLTSVCCPLGVQLPQTMRAKIVNSEFVDFGQLLEKTEHLGQDDKQYSLAVGQGGTLVWQESKPKRNINSVHTWASAFLIFSAVTLSAHPQRVQEMLKYAQFVRTAAARHKGWGWRSYDIQFRLRRQWQPQRSWATIDVVVVTTTLLHYHVQGIIRCRVVVRCIDIRGKDVSTKVMMLKELPPCIISSPHRCTIRHL